MLTAYEICRVAEPGRDQYAPRIVIDPWNSKQLNPNSYNLTLSEKMLWYPGEAPLDVREASCATPLVIPEGGFVLQPGELYLGCTKEYTESHNLIPMINGRSSLARLGISVHQTGGFGDISYCGNWTLEITCVKAVKIYAGMEFAQLCWFRPDGRINKTYGGKYQNSRSTTPVGSRISNEFEHSDPRTAAIMKGGLTEED